MDRRQESVSTCWDWMFVLLWRLQLQDSVWHLSVINQILNHLMSCETDTFNVNMRRFIFRGGAGFTSSMRWMSRLSAGLTAGREPKWLNSSILWFKDHLSPLQACFSTECIHAGFSRTCHLHASVLLVSFTLCLWRQTYDIKLRGWISNSWCCGHKGASVSELDPLSNSLWVSCQSS